MASRESNDATKWHRISFLLMMMLLRSNWIIFPHSKHGQLLTSSEIMVKKKNWLLKLFYVVKTPTVAPGCPNFFTPVSVVKKARIRVGPLTTVAVWTQKPFTPLLMHPQFQKSSKLEKLVKKPCFLTLFQIFLDFGSIVKLNYFKKQQKLVLTFSYLR